MSEIDGARVSDEEFWSPPKEKLIQNIRTTGRSWGFDEVKKYVPYSKTLFVDSLATPMM